MNRTHNWPWYAGFLVTYVLMLMLSEKIHWIAPLTINDQSLSDSAEGNRLSVTGRLGDSAKRWGIFVYDNDLRPQWKRQYYQPLLCMSRALSSDGNHIVNATTRNGDLQFATLSRWGELFKNTIQLKESTVAAVSGRSRNYVGVVKTHLLDEPSGYILLQTFNEAFLVDSTGKIVDYLAGYFELLCQHPPTLLTSIDTKYEYPNPDEKFSLNHYSISREGFELIHEEDQDRDSVLRKSKTANSSGDVISQESDHIRVLHFDQSSSAVVETIVPWQIHDGQIAQINDGGDAILMQPANDEPIVLSSKDGKIASRLNAPGIIVNTSRFINYDDIAFLSRENSQVKLNVWNWRDNMHQAVAIPSISKSTQSFCSLSCYWIFGIWSSVWLWQALRSKNDLHTKLVIAAIFTVVLRWLQTHPETESLAVTSKMTYWIPLLVCWQIFLSIVSLWLLESLKFSQALACIVLLSNYATYEFLSSADFYAAYYEGDVMYSSMFLAFGAGIIAASLLKLTIYRRLPSFSLADTMLLILAVALSVKLLTTDDNYSKMTRHLTTGLLLGGSFLLVTLLAYRLSSVARLWVYCGFVALLIAVLTISNVYSKEVFQPIFNKSFWIGLTCMTALGGLASWFIFTIVNRCTTKQEAVVDFRSPDHGEVHEAESLNWT